VFVDEAGLYLLPMAVGTWAPVGQTPVLRVPLTRDHLSAISCISPNGRLFLQVRQNAYDAQAVVAFLRVLLRKLSGKVLVIWDGSPIHRAQPIKDFLKRGAARRLWLEQLPGYAPDLNPDEGIGTTSSALSLLMCARPISLPYRLTLFALVSGFSTNGILFSVVLPWLVFLFSCLCRSQQDRDDEAHRTVSQRQR